MEHNHSENKQDPICGMPGKIKAHGHYFCSQNCIKEYETRGKNGGHSGHGSHSHHSHHAHMVEDFKKRFYVSLVLTLPVLFLSPLIQKIFGFTFGFAGDQYVLFVISSLIFFYGGWPFLKGLGNELKQKQPGMMTLIALAISVAYIYSLMVVFFDIGGELFFLELVTLIDIMLLGHWIEMKSVMGASNALESLAKLLPSKAHLVADDQTRDVEISDLKIGDVVLVKPGERIPSDGVVISGITSVDESLLTGESQPQNKEKGGKVIAGAVNNEGSIKINVSKLGKDSYINQVINLVQLSQESKSKTQNIADKAAFALTIVGITAGILTLILWFLVEHNLAFALERMVTVMVITCPHALGLAVPLVVAVSTSISAKNGLLIKNRDAFEKARNIDIVVFDKTGTLTRGSFGVTDIIAAGNYDQNQILAMAAALEAHSVHPIAKSILEKANRNKIKIREVERFKAIPGQGVQGMIERKNILAVGQNYLQKNNIKISDTKIEALAGQSKTIVFILEDQKILGAIALADIVREESKETIKKLKSFGIKSMMLTGDNKAVASNVASELDLDDYFAGVLPIQKSEIIKKLQSDGSKVAMVGDGVNDAPALVQADIGIAVGAGTDVAIDSGDVILVRSNPQDVLSVFTLARTTYKKMVQNLWWATGYNFFAIPLAAGAFAGLGIVLSPALGAALMSVSTVVVAINARFISFRG